MDNVKEEKNKFINDAIKEKEEVVSKKSYCRNLKISSSLSIIAGCLQKLLNQRIEDKSNRKNEEIHEETEDKDVQKKLSDFVMKYVDF